MRVISCVVPVFPSVPTSETHRSVVPVFPSVATSETNRSCCTDFHNIL